MKSFPVKRKSFGVKGNDFSRKKVILCQIEMISGQKKSFPVKRYHYIEKNHLPKKIVSCQRKSFPAKENHFLLKEILSC